MSKGNNTKLLSEAQRYDLAESAKDALFELINVKKYSWGYENWTYLHNCLRHKEYAAMEIKIKTFKNTKNRRYALELLRDIRIFSGSFC